MTSKGLGPRVALAWVRLLTATAPTEWAAERRAEITSDVYEQLQSAATAGLTPRAASLSVAGRSLRGMPADLAWRLHLELHPARRRWHLTCASTVLTFLFIVMAPINLLADLTPTRFPKLLPADAALWAITTLLGWTVLAVAAAAAVYRLLPSAGRDNAGVLGLSLDARLRRRASAALSIAWAASAVGRFSAHPLLTRMSDAAWVGVGMALAGYLLLLLPTLLTRHPSRRVLTLGR
ncbi:MAG TPA: hypothetical protein VM093_02125 [Aeromicrobium sp.]|nr:hypothetical protein [Aeromicrobium sp.]